MLSKPKFAGDGDEIAGHFVGLNAMDGFLDFVLEILDAHR